MYYVGNIPCAPSDIQHFGIKGMKWGVRRYQNPDGTLTAAGKTRYYVGENGEYKKRDYLDKHMSTGAARTVSKNGKEHTISPYVRTTVKYGLKSAATTLAAMGVGTVAILYAPAAAPVIAIGAGLVSKAAKMKFTADAIAEGVGSTSAIVDRYKRRQAIQ